MRYSVFEFLRQWVQLKTIRAVYELHSLNFRVYLNCLCKPQDDFCVPQKSFHHCWYGPCTVHALIQPFCARVIMWYRGLHTWHPLQARSEEDLQCQLASITTISILDNSIASHSLSWNHSIRLMKVRCDFCTWWFLFIPTPANKGHALNEVGIDHLVGHEIWTWNVKIVSKRTLSEEIFRVWFSRRLL